MSSQRHWVPSTPFSSELVHEQVPWAALSVDLPCSPEASFALGSIFLMVSLENAEHGFGSFLNLAGATVGEGLAALLEAAEEASPELSLSEPEQPATTSSTGTAAQVRRLASRLAERCMVPSLFVVVGSARPWRWPWGLPGRVRGRARRHGTRRGEVGDRFMSMSATLKSGDSASYPSTRPMLPIRTIR